jgi:amino acid transporter
MGFGIITNDSENIENPKKNVPRAIFTSILIVIFIYTMVSVSALSLLPVKELIMYKENALAKAVEPVLGKFGFLLVSLGALVSISSALNAALYSGANAAYAFMRNGYIPLPNLQRDRIWMSGHAGLYLTCALALVFAITFNVTSIASIISLITTIIYIFVMFSHLKLAKVIGGKNWLVFFNLIVVSFVAINIMKFQMESNPAVFFVSVFLFLVSYLAEKLYYGKLKAPPA